MFIRSFLKYFFFIQYTLICDHFSITKALVGPNVRLAHENEFPFVVSIAGLRTILRSRIHTLHRCTGTLITRQDVLTAEHCLRNTLTEGFKVLIGSADLAESDHYYPMFIWTYQHWALFIQRPNDGYDSHDIAFIKLTANVPSNFTVAPYGNIDRQLLFGLPVQTAGWGRIDNGTKPRQLRMADLTILTRYQCEIRLSVMELFPIGMDPFRICTVGDPYAITSHGDSGGPVLYYGVLVAINHGIIPDLGLQIAPHQVNIQLSIRYYQDFFEDIRVRFHVDFEH